MLLKKLTMNEQKVQKLLKSLLCFVCVFCFAGCESDSTPVSVQPQQDDIERWAENQHSDNVVSRQIEQLGKINKHLAGENNSRNLSAFPAPEPPSNSRPRLQTQDSRAENQDPGPDSGVCSLESDRAINTPEQLFSQGNPQLVNMPALNKSGMTDDKNASYRRDELISVNFERADIRTVLKTVGDITGINFMVDESVKGTVTLMSPTKIRLGELYEVLESILEVQGYAAVPAENNLVKIIPRADAAKRNLQVRVGSNPAEIPLTDSIVTQIIPLSYADAAEVSQIIQPLLATGSQMATYTRTNSIVITDTCSNIHHIATIIQELDVTGSQEQVTVFGLEYASAQVLSEQISRIMQKHRATQAARRGNVPQIETDIKIMPDARTNSLIVVANAQDTETIEALIIELDIQRPLGTNNVHVAYLQNAQAVDVAKSLTAALSNLKIAGVLEATQQIQVTADEGTNALIIAASAQDYEVIAEIIEKLDIVREQVLVEMLIMEIREDSLKEIGIDWATLDQAVANSTRFFGATNFGPRVDFVSGNLEGLAVGLWRGSNTNVGVIMHALEKQSGVNILSTPHILTSNHHTAKIIVGESRPFVIESRITEGANPITPTVIKKYQYKDVGITMEITPHISQGGLIRLEIKSEFSKLIEDVTTSISDTPTTAKREAETVISMNSDSTVVIGGLIRDDKITIEKKIPLVSDIPLVGGLFKFKKDQLQKTNLLIFITPHIMASQGDLERITEKKKSEIGPVLEDCEQKNGHD